MEPTLDYRFKTGPDRPRPKPFCPSDVTQGTDEFHAWLLGNPDEQRTWFDWYAENPEDFLRDCVKITDKEMNVIPLDVNHPNYCRAQRYYLDNWRDQWFTTGRCRAVILKARQWGATTLTKGLELFVMLFRSRSHALTVADDRSGSQGIAGLLHEMYEDLPAWIKPPLKVDNRDFIQFGAWPDEHPLASKNLSWIRVDTARNQRSGRKWRLNIYHGTEVAFWGTYARDVLAGGEKAISDVSGTMEILESTAFGWGGEFFERCQRSRLTKSPFRFIFIPWFAIDEYRIRPGDVRLAEVDAPVPDPVAMQKLIKAGKYDEAGLDDEERELLATGTISRFGPVDAEQLLWRRYTIEAKCRGDVTEFHQEYPATPEEAFIVTGAPVFSPSAVQHQLRNNVRDADKGEMVVDEETKAAYFQPTPAGRLKIWEHPKPGHKYLLAIDFSEGEEIKMAGNEDLDDTAFFLLDRSNGEQVAGAKGRWPPDEACDMAMLLAKYYNMALLVPENNAGWAGALFDTIRAEKYPFIYTSKVYDDTTKTEVPKLGWSTTPTSRPLLFTTARAAIRRREIVIRDADLCDQLMSMVYKPLPSGRSKEQAKPGAKDDYALAFAIAVRVHTELFVRNIVSETVERQIDPSNPLYHIWKTVLDNQQGDLWVESL